MSDTERESPVAIEAHQLSEDALNGIIEDFVLRQATDYGETEVPHARKVEQVRRQIFRGEVKVTFDRTTETVTLMTARDFVLASKRQS